LQDLGHKKTPDRNLTITGLIIVGMLAIPSLGHAEQVTYSYDDLNRLIKTDYGNGNVIDYAYDAAGNRTTQKVTTATNQLPIANAGPIKPCAWAAWLSWMAAPVLIQPRELPL
jgi:YD repeat-containing protein